MRHIDIVVYSFVTTCFAIASPQPTLAAIVTYSGSSSANYSSGPVSAISLSFTTGVFDDSVVNGVGTEFFDVPLTALTFSPIPLGTTSFNPTNAAFQLHYVDGNLFALRVGGVVDGVETIAGGSDDFMARYTAEGGPFQTAYRLAGSSSLDGNSFDMTGSITAVAVPEPSTQLAISGCIAVAALDRRYGFIRRSKT